MKDILLNQWGHQIVRNARSTDQRTGQWLFNHLPSPVASAVRGTIFDPFYKELTLPEIQNWIDEHLIFNDKNEIIGVFNDNTLLWGPKQ